MGDGYWWQLLLALGYGFGGAIIPVANGEAFIVAALATDLIDPVTLGLCLGTGQGAGKMLLFQMVRRGLRMPWGRRQVSLPRPEPAPGTMRARLRKLVQWGVRVVEHPRWGPAGVFMSGSISLPPNYVTTIAVAATRINFASFSIALTLGFVARYLAISLAAAGLLDRMS